MSTPTPKNESLQNYNHELVECIEDLRRKREEVDRQICKEEEDKAKVQKEILLLQDRLQKLNESLARKIQARNEYDKTIQETEAAYTKIAVAIFRGKRLFSAVAVAAAVPAAAVAVAASTAAAAAVAAAAADPRVGADTVARAEAGVGSFRKKGFGDSF